MDPNENKTNEFEDVLKNKKDPDQLRQNWFKAILAGEYLGKENFLKHTPFILLLFGIGLIYIANTYHAEYLLRKHVILEKQIRELSTHATSISSQLMQMSNQSAVSNLCKEKELGLHENLDPPYKIVLTKEDVAKINSKELKKNKN